MKDSYWFKHDSNAGRDLKLLEIGQIYTHWGKGIYWDVVEVLREQNDYKFDRSKLQVLCGMILCNDFVKFQNWYSDCVRVGLFIEDDKYFYSKSLLERMKVWESKKLNGLKPKLKRNRSEIEANRKHKIREDNNIEERKIKFINELSQYKDRYETDMLNDFYRYWAEKTKDGKKMKWETQKTWDLPLRLKTWERNQINFKRK